MNAPVRVLLACAALLLATSAQAVRITPSHSGSWFDPAFDKQGFSIEVLDREDEGPERRVVAYWFTYDDEGNPVWAIGVGMTERDTVSMTMQRAFGGARPPAQVEATDLVDWAEMTFTFGTCNTATADFTMIETGDVGHYDLQRLTRIGRRSCTGGLSDEVEPGEDEVTLVAQLQGASAGEGKLKFKLRPAFGSFEVEVRRIPAGTYTIRVGGVDEGELQVAINGDGDGIGKGETEFTSPQVEETDETEGTELLDFDPRGQLVEIVDAEGTTVLSAEFPAEPPADDAGDGDDDGEG